MSNYYSRMKKTSAVFLAGRLSDAADEFILAELRREGLTDLMPSHGDIFSALFAEDGQPMSAVAAKTHRTKSTVTALADRLQKSGYIERRKRVGDARVIGLYLTEKGRALEPIFQGISERLCERLTQGMAPEEVTALENLLQKGLRNF